LYKKSGTVVNDERRKELIIIQVAINQIFFLIDHRSIKPKVYDVKLFKRSSK